MARTPKNIISAAQLTTGATTYYTAPANTSCIIRKITFMNTTAGAITVTVYLVPSGDTAGDDNTIAKTYSIAANTAWSCPDVEGHVLVAGDFVQALASAGTSITIIGSGTEVT